MKINDYVGMYLNGAWPNRQVKNIAKIVIHHTAIPQSGQNAKYVLEQINKTHLGHGWPGISYHYFIHDIGEVYQLNSHDWVTWHDRKNYDSLSICLNGYFHNPKNESPTNKQLESLKALLDKLCVQHPEFPADQNDVIGHRDRVQTSCPGDNLYKYVKEYRDNKGTVDWFNQSNSIDKNMNDKEFDKLKEEKESLIIEKEKLIKALKETQVERDKYKNELWACNQQYKNFEKDKEEVGYQLVDAERKLIKEEEKNKDLQMELMALRAKSTAIKKASIGELLEEFKRRFLKWLT